jgi:hypothetical protein
MKRAAAFFLTVFLCVSSSTSVGAPQAPGISDNDFDIVVRVVRSMDADSKNLLGLLNETRMPPARLERILKEVYLVLLDEKTGKAELEGGPDVSPAQAAQRLQSVRKALNAQITAAFGRRTDHFRSVQALLRRHPEDAEMLFSFLQRQRTSGGKQ